MSGSDRFSQAAERRQTILLYLQDNPGAVLEDIRDHLGWTRPRTSQMLLRMERNREVRSAPGGVSRFNRPCARHFAVATVTATGSEMLARLTANLAGPGGSKTPRLVPRSEVPAPHLLFGGLGA